MAVTTDPILLPADPNPNQQRYGLFNAANGPLELPVHARNGGLQYTTNVCTLPGGYAINCTPGGVAKTFTDGLSVITGNPFVVIAETLCGSIGYSEAEWNQFVFQKLQAGEQAIVEQIFSAGTFGVAPSLSNNTPAASSAGASTSTAGAIGNLESWLYARYGPAGILHIPISDAARVFTSDFVTNVGGVWRTKMGTAVSFGNYANTGPTGTAAAAGHSFWYITGQMSIWRTPDSEVFISPWDRSINTTTNQLKMYAEREYVVAFDCQVAYTDITLVA
jgi:hypothetical protein